jgi:hypothetical protein
MYSAIGDRDVRFHLLHEKYEDTYRESLLS